VPHGHDEVGAHEEVDLAGLDRVLLVDVPEGLEHQEQRVAVALELGPLVGVARVLDGQGMQVEGPGDEVELLGARVVDADPLEVAGIARDACVAEALVVARPQRHPSTLVVEGVVDDHRLRLVAGARNSRHARCPRPTRVVTCLPSSSSDTAGRRPTPPACWPGAPPVSTSTRPG
jgi:hypothetical protein